MNIRIMKFVSILLNGMLISCFIHNFIYTAPTIYTTESTPGVDFYWYQDGVFQNFAGSPGTLAVPFPICTRAGATGLRGGDILGNGTIILSSDTWLSERALLGGVYPYTLELTSFNSVIFTGDVILSSALRLTYGLTINGNGNNFNFQYNGNYGTIYSGGSLSFKNIVLKNFNAKINKISSTFPVFFENAIIDYVAQTPAVGFLDDASGITVRGDVIIKGEGVQINIVSPILVMPNSRLYFDKGLKVNINNSNATIILSDPTSSVFFDGCEIGLTSTGLTFTSGTAYFDNRVTLSSTTSRAIQFRGASTAKFLSGARVGVIGNSEIKF